MSQTVNNTPLKNADSLEQLKACEEFLKDGFREVLQNELEERWKNILESFELPKKLPQGLPSSKNLEASFLPLHKLDENIQNIGKVAAAEAEESKDEKNKQLLLKTSGTMNKISEILKKILSVTEEILPPILKMFNVVLTVVAEFLDKKSSTSQKLNSLTDGITKLVGPDNPAKKMEDISKIPGVQKVENGVKEGTNNIGSDQMIKHMQGNTHVTFNDTKSPPSTPATKFTPKPLSL